VYADKKGGSDLFLHAESVELSVLGNSFKALVPLDQHFKI